VLALADERAERRGPDLAGAHVKLGLGVGGVVEQHPATDVLPLKVALRTRRRSQLYVHNAPSTAYCRLLLPAVCQTDIVV